MTILRSELVARLRERAQSREDEQKRTGARGERIALYNLRCRNDARLMREAADAIEADGPRGNCIECGQSYPAHSRDDIGTCERFRL
jgi:hypothetical protein